jgi:AraC-like DNA-binding protein
MSKNDIGGPWVLVLANVHYFRAPGRRILSRTRPPTHTLVIVLSGGYQATWRSGLETLRLSARAGDVVYWPAGKERMEVNATSERLLAISVYFRWFRPLRNLPPMVHDRNRLIRGLGDALLQVKDWPTPQRHPLAAQYLGAILAEYARLARGPGDDLEGRVARYVEEHMAEPITLDELARHVGVHKHHLGRRYKQLTGRTPKHDVRRIKAEHARGTLRGTPDMPLKDVAARVGIRDPFQLSKLLRRYLGTTARDIRA